MSTSPEVTRSGFCAIVGRPNVGKSTLLNALVGEKVAITTPVPQTTRHAVRGVRTVDGVQLVFVDTPGLHKPKTLLGSRLNETARAALTGVDVVAFVVDAAAGIGTGDAFVAGLLADARVPVLAVANKVDRLARAKQLPALAKLGEMGDWAEIVPVSAKTGEQVEELAALLAAHVPEGPALYPEDQHTDQELDQRLAELIREQAIVRMQEEVPHSVAVVVEEVIAPEHPGGATRVHATLFVERDSQKGIVIGHRGETLKAIGTSARPGMEELLGTKVFLDLRVKLAKEWQRDPRQLRRLGY